MVNKKRSIIVLSISLLLMGTFAYATVIVFNNPDQYSAPDGNHVMASQGSVYLDHYAYFLWRMDDINMAPSYLIGENVDIVFRNIHNWATEPNWLNVYIIDGNYNQTSYDWQGYSNYHSPIDWTGWTQIGSWSDPNGGMYPGVPTYDVVFRLTVDEYWANALTNGGYFFLGIDPECAFYNDGIEVTGPAPVPEPATLLLIGSGLLGLAGFRRRKN